MAVVEVSERLLNWITALNWSAEVGADLLTGGAATSREHSDSSGTGVPMIGYWENSLKNLSTEQRTVFTVFAIMVMVMAIFGNIVTIITNVRREQRHLFRVCLLSLAFSDIAFVTFTSIVYLSQFNTEFNSLWTLGELMCTFSPFVQTMAVLVNSITLVAIALDRYMAVVRLMKGTWEPNGWFCVTCAVLIWGLGAGISSPMLTLYTMYDIVVLTTDSQQPGAIINGYYMASICATDKSKNSYYFAIVFVVIFLPLLGAFCWLNGVIAKEIWIRRNPIEAGTKPTQRKDKQSSGSGCESSNDKKTLTTNTLPHPFLERRTPASVFIGEEASKSDTTVPEAPPKLQTSHNEASVNRRKRQLRMFKAIIVLMLVFFVCRLPMWIFLLIKMIGEANTSAFWNLHYSFGILAMLNAVLNPLMYTFLSETIRFTMFVKAYCVRSWVEPCQRGLQKVRRGRGTKERNSGAEGAEAQRDDGVYMGD
uniref:G-protein coupled receptors family 1 profile domain-containing protein n=1 Tax=Anopheles atroparvus TaxID=41427 RepID=A0AAG5DUN5_ANOAO